MSWLLGNKPILIVAFMFVLSQAAISYDKMEIFSFPWNISLRIAMNEPKEIIESHFSVYIREYIYDDNRIDAVMKELVLVSDETPNDLKLVIMLHSKALIDTISIDAEGYVYRNGKKYFNGKMLLRFISEYLPSKHLNALSQSLPEFLEQKKK